jgi:hypothetical protein
MEASYAVATGAYNFGYDMDAVDVIGKMDLVLHGVVRAPNNTVNFFGLAMKLNLTNQTVKNRSVITAHAII